MKIKTVKLSHCTPWRHLEGKDVQLLLFLDLGTICSEWLCFTHRGKDPPVPTVQQAGSASELVWTQRIEEKSFAPAGDRTPITELPWLIMNGNSLIKILTSSKCIFEYFHNRELLLLLTWLNK
jgi:hypothetical protein